MTGFAVLFQIVHPSDHQRMDIVMPGGRHIYLRAASTAERQQWLIALGSTKQGVVGDRITAENSWRHYVLELGYRSVGVLAVTVGECGERGLVVEADPGPFPEHVVIRFDGCSRSQSVKIAKHLTRAATERGWQYRAQ